MQPDMERKTYSVEEVAVLLGLSESAVYRACRDGDLPALRVGRRWLLPRGKIDDLANGAGFEPPQRPRRPPASPYAGETFAEEMRRKLDGDPAPRQGHRRAAPNANTGETFREELDRRLAEVRARQEAAEKAAGPGARSGRRR